MNMKKVSFICFVLCLLIGQGTFLTQTARGQQTDEPRAGKKDVNLIFRKYEIATLNASNVARQAREGQIISIRTATRSFNLEVKPFDLRSADYRAVEEIDGGTRELKVSLVTTFRGTIVGQPQTDVRLSIIDNQIEGMILTETEQLYIEPLKKFDEKASESSFLIYEKSDVLENVDLTLDEKVHDAAQEYAPMQLETRASSASKDIAAVDALRELEVATEADYEFVQSLGGAQAANNAILGILNQVDAIYRRELGLTVKVTYQSAWTTANDPYGAGLNALLDEFRNYWEANRRNVQRDIAHIFTNNSQNNVAGLAYGGVVCRNAAYSYGLSKYLSTASTRTVVTAHEIGHNLNASHVEGGDCTNTIMNPGVGPSTQTTFCQTSRNQITSYVNQNSSCLTETGGGGGIVSGGVYILHNQCSDKVADVSGVSLNNGAPIHLWTNFGAANQQFKVQDVGAGQYTLTAQHSQKVMDVQYSQTTDGALIWQWTPNGTNAQKWQIVDVGGGFYKLLSVVAPGKALDVSGASSADGARIQIWTDNGTCAQKWRFERRE